MSKSGFLVLILTLPAALAAQETAELTAAPRLEAEASLEELERAEAELEEALASVWKQKRVLTERAARGELGERGDEDEIRIVNGVLTS